MWEWLHRRYEKGLPVKQLDDKPPIDSYEQIIWVAFWKIRHGVGSNGMGGLNGISYRDILAWMDVERPYFQTAADRRDFVDILISLDKEFITIQYEKSKKDG